jgi:citronellol/citronellal dehydrogenase
VNQQSRDGTPRPLGFSIRELADHPTVYREGLLRGTSMLVSGGGSGIGRAIAVLATRLGAEVMICGRNNERLADTAEAIQRLLGKTIAYRAITIRDPDLVNSLLDETWERFGPLHCLVNSAGGQFIQPAIDFSAKGWLAVIDTNLNGTWWMMQAAGRRWRDAGVGGNIVNIVSVVDRGNPNVAHTSAARAGVIHLTRTLAVEWAPLNIRINCVAPGAVLSDGLGRYPEGHESRLASANPMRRLGDTWDMAEAVVYLTAPSGKFVTGELIRIDGGGHLWNNSWLLPGGPPAWFTDPPEKLPSSDSG